MGKTTNKPMDYDEFRNSVAKDIISPVYIFCGQDEHFISEAIKCLRAYLAEKFGDLQYKSPDLGAFPIADILFEAKERSLFGAKKLFVITGCDKLKKEDNSRLEEYINNPTDGTHLILKYADAKNMKLNTPSGTFMVDFSGLGKNTIFQLRKFIEEKGFRISNDSVQLLIDMVGNDLVDLVNEAMKLMAFLKDETEITESAISSHIKRTNFNDVFELINAVCSKDKQLALKALHDLEEKREEPIAILNRLSWRIRLIWQVKQMLSAGIPRNEIMSALKISSGNLFYMEKQARNFTIRDIQKSLNNIYRADLKLKSTQIPPFDILTSSVIEICS